MSNIDRLRVGGTDYDIQSVVKVYDTIADMNADIANIPNGATVFVKENSPSGLEGDDELDPTSSNWVKNSALAEVVVTVEDGSSTPSIPDSELRHSDMSNTQVNDVNKVPTSALLYQMNSDLTNIITLKTKTESLTTSNYGWLLFPYDKIILGASYIPSGSNYNSVVIIPDKDANRFIARGYINISSGGTYTAFSNSTAYNITYAYIDR